MKTKLFYSFMLAVSFAGFSQNVTIPDANFKAALVANANINTNGDTEIQITEASAYTGAIGVSNKNIVSLTGIEAFTEIVGLQAFGNSINTVDLDLSNNTKLKQLLIENNSISGTLDLSMMSNLTDFKGHTTNLTAINMANGNNSNVTRFDYTSGSLDCVQIDANFTPNSSWTDYISVSSVYTENCNEFSTTAILTTTTTNGAVVADVQPTNGVYTKGSVIELTANPDAGYHFDSWSGDVTSTTNPLSITIDADKNITANFIKSFVTLTMGVSSNGTVQANTQPTNGTYANGTVVELTATPDTGYVLYSWSGDATGTNNPLSVTMSTDKSITAIFSQNVNIPDANFKAALVANSNINTNGDTEIQLIEANAYTGAISVTNKSIVSLTGIEAFTEIIGLQVFNNPINTVDLDLSNNTKLKQLLIENTSISGALDLSMMPNLTDFKGHTTSLTAINMANGNNSNVTRFNYTSGNLDCVQIDANFTPNSSWTDYNSANYAYTENCTEFPILSIADETFKNDINEVKVSPNPASSYLNIETELGLNNVEVYNLQGAKVLTSNNSTIDVSNFTAGVYIIKVELTTGSSVVKRFVKQ